MNRQALLCAVAAVLLAACDAYGNPIVSHEDAASSDSVDIPQGPADSPQTFSGDGWTLVDDCRGAYVTITGLVSDDLYNGRPYAQFSYGASVPRALILDDAGDYSGYVRADKNSVSSGSHDWGLRIDGTQVDVYRTVTGC